MKKQIIKPELIGKNVLLEQKPTEDQEWLFRAENKKALEKVKEGLQEKGTIDRGAFFEYLEEK